MISPEDYLENLNSIELCKLKSKITGIKFLKEDFHDCSLSSIFLETETGVYLQGDMDYKECVGGENSFDFYNLPKIGDELYFFVNAKSHYIISQNSNDFFVRTGYDFTKVPFCDNKVILKEKYEKGYDLKQFKKELDYFEEWENYQDFESIYFPVVEVENLMYEGFSYQRGRNSHNQIVFEKIYGTFGAFKNFTEIDISSLRKEGKIVIPELSDVKNESIKNEVKEKFLEVYKYVKTGEIGENIKVTGEIVLKEDYYLGENNDKNVNSQYNLIVILYIVLILLIIIIIILLKMFFKKQKNK